jgi:hypothetical protein
MTGRFTSGPSRAVPPNKAMPSGNRPTLATPCAARNPRRLAPMPARTSLGRHHTSHSTPPKLSQKPADSTDSGAGSSIASAASASPCTHRAGDAGPASATSPIISAVRTVGSAPPASYRIARCGQRRHMPPPVDVANAVPAAGTATTALGTATPKPATTPT